ncbi:MAG: hypothetical protein ACLQKA_13585 [Bryobacteraceae bacterium]
MADPFTESVTFVSLPAASYPYVMTDCPTKLKFTVAGLLVATGTLA